MNVIPTSVAGCFMTDERFTPELVSANTDTIFIFGDNERRYGKGGQAIIRDFNNSFGLRTKGSIVLYWNDETFEHNKRCIDEDVRGIKQLISTNLNVVFSTNGYGTGLAELPHRAPKTYQYLIQELNTNFGTNY